MEISKKDGLEQAKLEKFKIIKNGQNPLEFDFKFHLVTGINAFVEPKIERSTAKDYFDNHILKGFIYNTYIINDIDYVLSDKDLMHGKYIIIKRGKKNYYIGKIK